MSIEAAVESGKFTIRNLTQAINKTKVPKRRLEELGLFKEKGITQLHAEVEYKKGRLILVTDKERGEEGDAVDRADRDVVVVKAVHLPVTATLTADDLQGVREFGVEPGNDTGNEQFDKVIDELSETMRGSIDVTIEALRFGALKGKVIGKSGKVRADFFKLFDISEADAISEIDPTGTTKSLRNQLAEARRISKSHQDGVPATRWRNLVSPELMDMLLENDDFRKAYDRYQDSQAFRENVRGGIFWDDMYWEEHSELMPDGEPFIPAGEGLMIPENNAGLFMAYFCPANYNETVGTVGYPYYMVSEPKKFNKGLDMEAQSNVILICSSPLAVRQLKLKAEAPAESRMSPEAEQARQDAIDKAEAKKAATQQKKAA